MTENPEVAVSCFPTNIGIPIGLYFKSRERVLNELHLKIFTKSNPIFHTIYG